MKLFLTPLFTLLIILPSFSQQEVRWACKIAGTNDTYNGMWYSPKRVLGVPDVYPGYGEAANGYDWAPGYNDNGLPEKDVYISVSFCDPIRAQQVVILENANPGAITSVTITEQSGQTKVIYKAKAADLTVKSRILS